jgi:hypothetical protein
MMKEKVIMKKFNVKYEFYGIDQDTGLVFFGDGKGKVEVKTLGELVAKYDKQDESEAGVEPALNELINEALEELDADRRVTRASLNGMVA